ncbi:sushi, von Willebrand factor type A, EGF and pentraxin domain-containing protein 1-like [Mya arenaria]|uniref:sushi, von Willebrand factor type A, EGF and pentraxin domain-containing protein 1-like n=1 Tax=Mya arenaria TaxID=6604 RepID=UPI0022E08EB1|nr:sushi, von Willebrand factor type A, EGF and pentraxin domain-containing protein 1-like [Mya arenaria]
MAAAAVVVVEEVVVEVVWWYGRRRKKRFWAWGWCWWWCGSGSEANDNKAPPEYTYCPSSDIKHEYTAPQGEKQALVQWTEPIVSEVDNQKSSQTCCGPYKNGDKFPGSIDGTTHYITYTVKDDNGRIDSCSFKFTVFYLACSEPYVDDHTTKTNCSDGNNEGSICHFRCVEGYKFGSNGPTKSTCLRSKASKAYWTTFPKCQKKNCQPPFALVNGEVSCISAQYLYDETCVFTCNEGYKLEGASSMYCMENENWSKSPTDISCEDNDPPVITCLRQTFYADRGSFSTHVYWEEPTVTDNVDTDIEATKVSNGINQGDVLSQGTYEKQHM